MFECEACGEHVHNNQAHRCSDLLTSLVAQRVERAAPDLIVAVGRRPWLAKVEPAAVPWPEKAPQRANGLNASHEARGAGEA